MLLVFVEQSPRSPAAYRAEYDRILPDLAEKYDQQLYPSFLHGVAGRKELLLDRVHPNGEGTRVIVDNILSGK
jgi:acyl-CoA thioesterase-1